MAILFIHGAGGYVDDQAIADRLTGPVTMPEFPDVEMSVEAWAAPIRKHLSTIGPDDLVVAHSFGASVLLKVLTGQRYAVGKAILLAMPDWTPEGWDVPDYAFAGNEQATALSLHHCIDDDVVPHSHLALHARTLSSARVFTYESGGHQFEGVSAAELLR